MIATILGGNWSCYLWKIPSFTPQTYLQCWEPPLSQLHSLVQGSWGSWGLKSRQAHKKGVDHQQEAGTKQEWLMLLFFLGLGIVDHSPKSVTIAIYISYTCYQNCYRHMICYIPLGGFKDCLLSTTIGGLETTKRNWCPNSALPQAICEASPGTRIGLLPSPNGGSIALALPSARRPS
jgi:hypothetical protein